MSRTLDKQRAESNALRTLDERRQAQAARDVRTPPQGQGQGYGYGPAPAPAPAPAQAPIIVHQGGGLGHVVAGAIIARSAANAHANNNNSGGYYPAPSGGGGALASQAGGDAVDTAAGSKATAAKTGGSLFGAVVWLLVLALIAWVAYTAWKRVRSRREANKPNYSFERN